jgi:L-threonylcarbamoyladenylate synthase
MTKPLKPTLENIKKAAKFLRQGGLVAFPTETVYGLGADTFNSMAVAKIFEVKNRPNFDPIIVHIADLSQLYELCSNVDKKAEKLIEKFWPGPLTIVLPKKKIVPDIVTAGLSTVAVRMPENDIALKLIEFAKTPIAAPSANIFGRLSPTSAYHVKKQFGSKIRFIIDGGKTRIGIESTVVSFDDDVCILRLGGLAIEKIKRVVGKVKIITESLKPKSPGQLPKHYAPKTPLKIINKNMKVENKKRIGFLAFMKPKRELPYKMIEVLSPKGDLCEAAANFFSSLHKLDNANLDIIYAEPLPEIGLGRAIMDRLHKAETKE